MSLLLLQTVLLAVLAADPATAQQDPAIQLNRKVLDATQNQLGFTFEERTRWEEKDGVNFGKSVNQQDMLSRIRIGANYRPFDWLLLSAMGQDSRAPFYGTGAPNSLRDSMDLQEGYVELFHDAKTGFGALFGREMLNYGEARLIGSPQWSNLSRTYDTGRVYYRLHHARIEALMVSPVKIQSDNFNAPDLGERIWGTYDVFPKVWKGASFDTYALRHSQNKIGGWTGAGTLGTNTFGGRFYGPLPLHLGYSFEGAGQTGHLGPLTQRAYAWYAALSEATHLRSKPLALSVEYKAASGTQPGSTGSGTFDQLSPANHDKFGHEDLFGWRNLRTLRSLDTLKVTKKLALNLMYSNEWLDSTTDALYNSSGGAISVSKKGTAGRHVGQELDGFLTWQAGPHLFGAGMGHFFKGKFVDETTSHINPRYFYIFQQYSFK